MLDKNISDEELILLLQADPNHRYFSLLVQRHDKYILKMCKSYVKDDEIAGDLCQEIFIKLFLKINTFKREARFSTWLFAIIHNTCIDHLRKNKKQIRQVLMEKMADEVAEMIDDVDEVPEDLSAKILDQLLDELSPDEKMILLMKYQEKHSIRDIQVTLNLSESAVKMRLKRAKNKVGKLYSVYRSKLT